MYWTGLRKKELKKRLKMTPLNVDKDQMVIIGNKPDFVKDSRGGEIRTEPYLRVVIDKLIRHQKIYIKTMPFPEKLGRLQELFELLKFYGVTEIENRKRIFEPSIKNPEKKTEVMIITWEMHPKMVVYRDIEIYRKMGKE